MKMIIACSLMVVVSALPQSREASLVQEDPNRTRDRLAQITNFENVQTENGGNKLRWASDNGLERQEDLTLITSEVINEDGEVEIIVVPSVEGYYRVPLDNGTVLETHYYTDENGIHFETTSI